jgi:hypothetical protein
VASITASSRPTSRYRAPHPARHLPPAPPQWVDPIRAFRPPPAMWRFVLLSMLLHAMLIALFGAPTGGSSEGRAMWGSMQVELRGLLIEAPRPPAPALRMNEPERETPAPAREDRGPAEGAVPLTPPIDTPAAATAPSGAAIVEIPAPFPPLLDRLPSATPRLDEPPPLRVPPPTEGRVLRPPPRERPAPAQAEVPSPLPLAPAPHSERVLAEPPVLVAPVLQPVPVPIPEAPVAPPVEAPPVPAPVSRPAETAPIEVQAIPVPALENLVPQRGEAPRSVEIAPMPEIRVAPAPAPSLPERSALPPPAAPEARDRESVRGPDFRSPPAGDASRPGAQRRPGDPSTTYDPTASPALDPDALRRRAGQLAREGSGQRALLPFPMPPVPEKKSRMEQAIENARKPDCRSAYQGLGLAAVVPLIANEFGEGSCTWNK